MIRFIQYRIASLLAKLFVSSFVIYLSLDLAPGSPLAVLSGGRSLSPDAIAALERRYHLNDPFLVRYGRWLMGALRGDFGESVTVRGQSVSGLIAARLPTTLALVGYSAILIIAGGLAIGLVAGLKPGRVDTGMIAFTTFTAAVPAFVSATMLISVFSVNLGWFPALGNGHGFFGTIEHLTLPAIALALSAVAIVARVTRASVRAEVEREHVQTAISRGIAWRKIVRRHILRNAAIPITTVSGVMVASLIGFAAVVERAFGLNGLGSYLVSAAASKDFAVVQGISLVLITIFVVVNTLVDVLYSFLDPRVTIGSRAS